MSIEVINETSYEIELLEFTHLCEYLLQELFVSPSVELNLIFVEPHYIAKLHEEYLGLSGPTDVMSFPIDELSPGTRRQPTTSGVLGDVFICPEVAIEQCKHEPHGWKQELQLLTTHGILHLLGYDHQEEEERKVMFDLQRRLLLSYLAKS